MAHEAAFWNAVGVGLQPLLRILERHRALGTIRRREFALPAPPPVMPATSFSECDKILKKLQDHKQVWVDTSTKKRAELLAACIKKTQKLAPEIAIAGATAKGSYESGYGEELASVLPIITGLAEYRESMLADGAVPPLSTRQLPNGQTAVRVWPRKMVPTFFPNFVGELWLEPGQPASQGQVYRAKAAGTPLPGRVSLVLGAGNQASVVALDILHKLFTEDEVVLVKMNPVNDYLGPLLADAFSSLVELGVLDFVYGGVEVGRYLTTHPLVDSLHLTGSEATYNAIVWGAPDAPRTGSPPFTRAITAELGNVTPYIIVPGEWSSEDIRYHAENVVSGLVQNTGHNCLGAEVVVTDAAWPQRLDFLAALRRCLSEASWRTPYYPGAAQKYAAFKARFPQAEALGQQLAGAGAAGSAGAEPVPWLLAAGLSPEQAQVRHENWCGVLQEVALPGTGGDPTKFLAAAVDFANNKVWGTLACSVTIHPQTQQAVGTAWLEALQTLRYGSITVNCPALLGFATSPLSWGGYPGHTPQEIVSGTGVVHNTYLFDHVQKSVLTGPWTYYPGPLWSAGQLNLEAALPWAFRFLLSQQNPLVALVHLVMVAVHALRGSFKLGVKQA